jgi:epsilon-lactone hydrolase
MASDALEGIITMLREGPLDLSKDPVVSRPIFEAMFEEVPKPGELIYEQGNVGGINGLWIKSPSAPVDQVILYLHGGAYVIGSTNSYGSTMGALAAAAGISIFAPEYRLAPEHPFPAAPDDVLAAYRGLVESGVKTITVAGDSAGGGLVMALLLEAKSLGLKLPAGGLLWSPWLDLNCDTASFNSNAANDPTLDLPGLQASVRHYLGSTIPADERLNPLEADLSDLPPLFIQVGSIEILLDDSTRLAALAGAAGVHTRLDIYPDMPHVFPSFSPMLEEANQALSDAAVFIHACAAR